MFTLKVPVICVVLGVGARGGALGIAIFYKVLMMENAWYSVISPENCSTILWRSWDYKEQAADVLRPTAKDMLKLKLIDGIIKEPLGGAHTNLQESANFLKKALLSNLESLEKKSPQDRIENRLEKFSAMGNGCFQLMP